MALYHTSYQKYSTEIKEAIAVSKNPNLFPDLNIPRSTAKGWIKKGGSTLISKSALTLAKQECLKQKIQRQEKKIIELESSLKLLQESLDLRETSLKNARVKDLAQKRQLLTLISNYQQKLPQHKILSILSLSKSEFKRWKEDIEKPSKKEVGDYVQQHPLGITQEEFLQMKSMCEDQKFAHFPISSLHYYAKRENILHCSLNTWYRFSRDHKFNRPYQKNYFFEHKEGIRTISPNLIWHIDITEIKLPNGRKYYLQAIIDNFSRYCIAWQIKSSKKPLNSLELLESIDSGKANSIMMDKGGENIEANVTSYLKKYKIKRIIARFDVSYSNSIVESFFRSLKSNYLHFQKAKSLKDLKSKVSFYISEYNNVIPHYAHQGLTPNEVYEKKSTVKFKKQMEQRKKESINARKEKYYSSA